MKKLFSGLIAFVMVMSLVISISGCKNSKEDVNVIHWYMQKPVSDMSRQKEVEDAANKIIYEKLGVKLQFHFIETAAWAQKINVLLSTNSDYDIITLSGNDFISNAQKECFANVGDVLKENAPVILEKSSDFAWKAATVNGKIVGIPGQTFYVPYSAFAFKKDLVDKYGFDYENAISYEAIEPFMALVKENEKGITPLLATSKGGVSEPKSMSYSATNIKFLYFDNENEEFKVEFFVDDIKENNRKKYEFAKKGYIARDAIAKTQNTSEAKSGKYAIVNGRRSAEKSTNLYGFECVESQPTYGVISTTNVLNSVNAISAKSKHVKEAVQLLNLIWEDTYLSNTLAYGIEGKDYTVSKGDVNNYKDVEEIRVETNSGTDVKWSIWHNWLGPLWDQWDSPWNSRESLLEMQKLNTEAEVSPIIGFIIDTNPIKTQIAQIMSIYENALQVFNTGTMKNFDEYIKELENEFSKAGIDEVIDEVEKQYNAWKKNN